MGKLMLLLNLFCDEVGLCMVWFVVECIMVKNIELCMV